VITTNVWNAFLERAEASPAGDAIVREDGTLTFDALRTRAAQYAAILETRGVGRHDRVLLWVRNDPEMAAALLGAWAVEAIPVLMDADETARNLAHAVERVSPRQVVRPAAEALPAEVSVPELTPADVPRSVVAGPHASRALPTDPASIVFTSGSTGKPKGVTQSHGSLVRACRAVAYYLGLSSEDRILCSIPWSFDYGYGQLLSTLVIGATHVLPSGRDPISVCTAIERHRPSVLPGIPSVFTYLLRGVSPFRDTDVSSIRTLTNTGGTIPGAILGELLEMFTERRLFLNYGLTESYRTSYLDPRLVSSHSKSIGRPVPGVDVVIVREDGGSADEGEAGEIVHRGDFLFLGYWNDPEATAKALRPDPLVRAESVARFPALFTGDLGYLDEDGLLYFVGRNDHLIKSMGVRVSPGDVEEILDESGLVKEVAVFGMPHEMIGQEVWVAVTPKDETVDVVPELKILARERLSPYMTPRRYIVRDALPKTRTGKIDYVKLKDEARR